MAESFGSNLVFLISQPRAGSTLLQRILGSHPAVHTVSEPWLMLHPFYALRQEGLQAEYSSRLAWSGLQSFIMTLPGGEEEYYHGVRAMCSYLYSRALQDSGKRYFVDKTPRYYFVIPELFRVFPEATYIILLRNPAAVLNSILNTWVPANWLGLYTFKHDLMSAPRLLLDGLEHVGERGIVVNFEEFVQNTEPQLRKICHAMGIDFVSEMIDYGHGKLPHWQHGDQERVYQHSSPVSAIAEKWTESLENAQTWRLLRDYLQLLGQDTVEQMGYSCSELEGKLERFQPNAMRQWLTIPLDWLLKEPPERRGTCTRILMQVGGSVRARGARGTVSEICRRAFHALP